MGMDTAKPFKPADSAPEIGEVRDPDVTVISDHRIGHITPAVDQEADLPVDLSGKRCNLTGQFAGDDLALGGLSAVKPLQPLELACLEACGLAVYLLYIAVPR